MYLLDIIVEHLMLLNMLFAGIVAGPLLLRILRKKKLAQLDAEYEKILQSMRN